MKSRMAMEAQNKLLSIKILSPGEGHVATWANCETSWKSSYKGLCRLVAFFALSQNVQPLNNLALLVLIMEKSIMNH